MRTPDVDLIQMTDSPVARSDCDIFELNVHIIFGYNSHYISNRFTFAVLWNGMPGGSRVGSGRSQRTFEKLAPIDLARRDLEGYNMALRSRVSIYAWINGSSSV
jgi:hypothetical protein